MNINAFRRLAAAVSFFVSLASAVSAQAPTTLYEVAPNEEGGGAFGQLVRSTGDFNHDGYDDFAVGSWNYTPNGSLLHCGKVSLYSGKDASVIMSWTGTSANDYFGTSFAALGDVNGDGVADFAVGAPQNFGSSPAYVRVFSGADGHALYQVNGSSDDQFGRTLAAAGDVNGDGVPDFAVGAPWASSVQLPVKPDVGMVQLRSGANGNLLQSFHGSAKGDRLGAGLCAGIDLNHDGVPDLAASGDGLGISVIGNNGFNAGTLKAFSGANGSVLFSVSGNVDDEVFGSSPSWAGDVNGDGTQDLIVGAPGSPFLNTYGYARVLSGTNGATLLQIPGITFNSHFGIAVEGVGDMNQDGTPDLAVGSDWDAEGHVSVFSGLNGSKLYTITGYGGLVGRSIAKGGDINGDGLPDFLIGIPDGGNLPGSGIVRAYSSNNVLPSIVSIAPSKVSTVGGTIVTLHGFAFSKVTSVKVGSVLLGSFTVVSDSELRFPAPAQATTGVVPVSLGVVSGGFGPSMNLVYVLPSSAQINVPSYVISGLPFTISWSGVPGSSVAILFNVTGMTVPLKGETVLVGPYYWMAPMGANGLGGLTTTLPASPGLTLYLQIVTINSAASGEEKFQASPIASTLVF